MSYVFYDVETTGLSTDFDQITQFAAVRTDLDFNVVDSFEIRAQIGPFLVPSPKAMCINGTTIAEMTDSSLPTFYQTTHAIYKKLASWTPSVFVGYNSIKFDEEMLRKSFYRTLLPEYLTNTSNNSRVDAWLMMVSVANHHPGLINVGIKEGGEPSFKLVDIAAANGIAHQKAHDAMSDVAATLELCKLIEQRAPERWSDFMQLSRKPAVEAFLQAEELYCLMSPYRNPNARISHLLGQSRAKSWVTYTVDMQVNHSELSKMSLETLTAYLGENTQIVREIKANAFPLVSDIDNAEEFLGYSPIQIEGCEHSLQIIHKSPDYRERLIAAADSNLPEFPVSPYPEKKLYGHGFVNNSERNQLWSFHDLPWESRSHLLKNVADPRYQRLGAQLIYAASPDSLSIDAKKNVEHLMAQACLHGDGAKKETLSEMRQSYYTLFAENVDNQRILHGYLDYLGAVESYAQSRSP